MRLYFVFASLLVVGGLLAGGYFYRPVLWGFVVAGPLVLLGYVDFFQRRQTIRRNFPVLGWGRYLLEAVRPEIHQYFVESNSEGAPFSREERSIVYQRAKQALDTLPFGTQKNVYEVGYEWVNHSLLPIHVDPEGLRITVGGPDCKQPYTASLLNVSAMSYGALSKNAILALNGAALDGGFAHNTGEGGLSPHHQRMGGDLVWQIGTGYFGCRGAEGAFSGETFAEKAVLPQVKMIEIKLSQGAKPGHGGILPAKKLTPEIAAIRGVPLGRDVVSPPGHSAFATPVELLEFVARLRDLSGGKPVGFKLCVGKRREFLAICKAMEKTGITPDFITVDGGEGGTGAAPLEFSNYVGSPGTEALIFVHNSLRGFGLREQIRIAATGKISTGFGVIKRLAMGADFTFAARAMMLALGCIQAIKCNTNECPTGITTQKASLAKGLVVKDKRARVAAFQRETISSTAHLLGAMGLEGSGELRPWHIMRRLGPAETRHYGEIFEYLEPGCLVNGSPPASFARALDSASAETFRHNEGGA